MEEKIYYLTGGQISGDAVLVFIHGAGGSSEQWAYQIGNLRPQTGAIALDLPGHGRSAGDARSDIGAYAEVTINFLRRLTSAPLVVVGHSMGGAIALAMALTYPREVAGLVLVSTGAKLRVHPRFLHLLAQGDKPDIIEYCFSRHCSSEVVREQADRWEGVPIRTFYADFLACDRFDIREELPRINCPVLILCGEEDLMTPPKYSQFLAEHIRHSTLKLIPQAGHMLMLEKPAELTKEIQTFFDRIMERRENRK